MLLLFLAILIELKYIAPLKLRVFVCDPFEKKKKTFREDLFLVCAPVRLPFEPHWRRYFIASSWLLTIFRCLSKSKTKAGTRSVFCVCVSQNNNFNRLSVSILTTRLKERLLLLWCYVIWCDAVWRFHSFFFISLYIITFYVGVNCFKGMCVCVCLFFVADNRWIQLANEIGL